MDINDKLAGWRTDADALYKTSKNMSQDAASLYSRIEKLHAAKMVLEQVRNRLLVLVSPEDAEQLVQDSLAHFADNL